VVEIQPACEPGSELGSARAAFTRRLATEADIPELAALVDVAIDRRLGPLLTPELLAFGRSILSLDLQLMADRPCFVSKEACRLAGCGGWSARRTR
jgi:hypothetical protein